MVYLSFSFHPPLSPLSLFLFYFLKLSSFSIYHVSFVSRNEKIIFSPILSLSLFLLNPEDDDDNDANDDNHDDDDDDVYKERTSC